MEVRAKAKYIKISPRKARLVVGVIRGLKVEEALDQLTHISKWAVRPLKKLLDSAIANGVNDFELKKENLYIKELKVDDGPTLHRWKPRARGRATPIRKRTSHVSIVLAELVDSGEKKSKQKKIEAPIKIGHKPKEDDGVKVESKKEAKTEEKAKEDKGKKIIDPRAEGRGKHTAIEGKGRKGFVDRMFRRKSG